MTDWHLVHYGKYAYAKFGLIFTEVLCVEKRGRSTWSDAGIWNDSHVRQLKKIAAYVRAQGSIPAAQIGHCGPKSSRQRPYDGLQPLKNIQNKESLNLSNVSENSENQLSDEILKQINLEVTEFQKAFKENGSEELISQTIRETIKPILYEWLKINLPVIVKEVIDEKINEIREKN